jgi:hypothetical protein
MDTGRGESAVSKSQTFAYALQSAQLRLSLVKRGRASDAPAAQAT